MPGVCAVLVSSESPRITFTPPLFQSGFSDASMPAPLTLCKGSRGRNNGKYLNGGEAGAMTTSRGNLFAPVDTAAGGETIEKILATPNATIERIVSLDHATPPGEWYDQEQAEWVVVLRGAAGL